MSKAKGGKPTAAEEAPIEPTNGNGDFTLPDRSTYSGDWLETAGVKCRHGHGTFTMGTETYVGEWGNDAMEGHGEYTFSSGATYNGHFKNNLFDGEGTYTFADGATYVGNWQNNKMHGKGEYTDPQGAVTSGEFVNGIYCSGEKTINLRQI